MRKSAQRKMIRGKMDRSLPPKQNQSTMPQNLIYNNAQNAPSSKNLPKLQNEPINQNE